MFFDLASLDGRSTYKLMTSTVVPRPIAWVVTVNSLGRPNAAPFSFFGLMSGDPPVICIGVGARDGQPKDTGTHLKDGGEFVVNLVSRNLLEAMNVTAIDFPPEVDELSEARLETLPSRLIAPPRIAESPVAFECRTRQVLSVAEHRWIIIGDVLAVHVRDDAVLDPDRHYIDTAALQLVGRMQGGGSYSFQTDLHELPRLSEEAWRKRRRS